VTSPAAVHPQASAVLTKAVLRAAAHLQIRQRQLAGVLGCSEASVSRLQHVRWLAPETKEGELALLFLRVFRSLDALMGGDDTQAAAWLHADNSHLGGPPVDRMQQVEGLVDVVRYLDALRGRL
jgi:hypothetical protein